MFTPRKSCHTVKQIFQPWSGSPQNSKFKIHPNSPEIPTYAIHTNRIFYEIYKDLHWRWNKERILMFSILKTYKLLRLFGNGSYPSQSTSRKQIQGFRCYYGLNDEMFFVLRLFSEMRLLPASAFYKKFAVFQHGRVTSPVYLPEQCKLILYLFRPTQQHINKNSTNHWKSFILKDYPACKFVINMIPYFLQYKIKI